MAVEKWEVRVGDEERQACVDDLRTHFGLGRLTLDEFEDRTEIALAARIQADLVAVTADLPALRRQPAGAPVRAPKPKSNDTWDVAFRIHVGIWSVLAAFFVFLWLLTGAWGLWIAIGATGMTVAIHAVIRAAVRPS